LASGIKLAGGLRSLHGAPQAVQFDKTAYLMMLWRWYPCSSLEAWHIRQCDRVQRPARFDP